VIGKDKAIMKKALSFLSPSVFCLRFLPALLALAATAPAWGRPLDRVVAIVNDEVILLSELDRLCLEATQEVPSSLPAEEAKQRKKEIRQQALDSLIESTLIRQQVREHKVMVLDQEVDDEIKRVMDLNHLTREQLIEALKTHEGKTIDQFKEDRRRDMEQQKLIDLQIRDNPELKGRLQVSEKDVMDAYQSMFQSAGANEKVRASHILFSFPPNASAAEDVAIQKKAARVLQELRSGASFEETAKKISDDPSSTAGGDLGFFRRGDMVPAFDRAAFGLKVGELSGLVKTQFGIHIIKVTDRIVEGPRPLQEVENEIRGRLQRERFQRVVQDWLDGVRQKAAISIKL
jgi:peptidyl-prolyl cis-trans isomerase SurA